MGGTGKSFFVHLLSTLCRQIFQTNTVDIKVAPTGTAAYNIGGETCHSAFAISVNDSKKGYQYTRKKSFTKTTKNTTDNG